MRPLATLALVLLIGCGSSSEPVPDTAASAADDPADGTTSGDRFPDVIDASARWDDQGRLTLAVTISSPYDTPERYADAWRALTPGGDELGVRILAHDHANEQPFTRSLTGIEIPDGVTTITIEARDLRNGWGGATLELDLPPRP